MRQPVASLLRDVIDVTDETVDDSTSSNVWLFVAVAVVVVVASIAIWVLLRRRTRQ